MSIFSSNSKNRRCRPRSRSVKETAPFLVSKKQKGCSEKVHNDDLGVQAHRLHARIGALESFLEKKNVAEARRAEMREQNILPPPDKISRRPAKRRQLSHAERRRYHAERNRNGIHFFLLFCLACGIAWCLIFSGI